MYLTHSAVYASLTQLSEWSNNASQYKCGGDA